MKEEKSKKPEYSISIPHREEGSEKTYWVQCGAAFLNKDGSLSIKVKASSHNGEYVAFPYVEKEKNAA